MYILYTCFVGLYWQLKQSLDKHMRKIISDQRLLLCYHIAGMATDLMTRCLNIAQFSVARTNSKANNIHIAQLSWNYM